MYIKPPSAIDVLLKLKLNASLHEIRRTLREVCEDALHDRLGAALMDRDQFAEGLLVCRHWK